ncbi:MAG TPA: rhomboid family intramembrane serine protease [Chitinophagaceae bacterium]|nr:rhomboid family intramembrane serine protease [Chitinophagaceae bacterium]
MNVQVRYERKKIFFGETNNVVWRLIIANAVLFTGLYFVQIIYLISGQAKQSFLSEVLPWAVLPGSLQVWITRPWTLFTFMFVHAGFLQLLTNMVWLWWFGTMLQDFAGHRKLLPLYLYGGIAGALVFFAFHYLFAGVRGLPATAVCSGAGASIMAIAVTVTLLVPGYRIFPMLNGGIPLWIITLIFIAIDIASMPAPGLVAQLGGAAMGLAVGWQMKQGNDWTEWLSTGMDRVEAFFDPETKRGPRSRGRGFYKQQNPPFRRIGSIPEKKVDELLDKINREGYDSLSAEEKDILVRASRQEE